MQAPEKGLDHLPVRAPIEFGPARDHDMWAVQRQRRGMAKLCHAVRRRVMRAGEPRMGRCSRPADGRHGWVTTLPFLRRGLQIERGSRVGRAGQHLGPAHERVCELVKGRNDPGLVCRLKRGMIRHAFHGVRGRMFGSREAEGARIHPLGRHHDGLRAAGSSPRARNRSSSRPARGPNAQGQCSGVPRLRHALPQAPQDVWKPSSLETFDIYMRGRLKLDTIDHARVSAWFDAASAECPGAANRAFDILRAMLKTARQWGELGEHVPDACANIAVNPKKPVARYLDKDEIARLGAVLDRHAGDRPWHVAALRLLALTGMRLSEAVNLRWHEIGELSEDGASAGIEDSKTGPRPIWLGPEAVKLVAELPRAEGAERVFPDDLTASRLYIFWCRVREEVGLPDLRIHDCRHTWASQGIMNGVGLPTVGRLLGHRRPATTAIYAHLDDSALQAAAEQAAGRIAKAMGFKGEPPPEKPDSMPTDARQSGLL